METRWHSDQQVSRLKPLHCDEMVSEDSKFEVLTASLNYNCHLVESVCLGRLRISVNELAVQMIVKETGLHHVSI